MDGVIMNKEQMELKKVICDGVAEGIKKGIESVTVDLPQTEVKDAYSHLTTSARDLKRFCEKTSCCDCVFMDVVLRCCNINQPEDWDI